MHLRESVQISTPHRWYVRVFLISKDYSVGKKVKVILNERPCFLQGIFVSEMVSSAGLAAPLLISC